MLKNLWLVALRNIKKDKGYTFLNVIGLAVGITCCLFLIFYIQDELSFDRYNEKADRIVRINSYIDEPENHRNFTGVSPELMFECVMEWSGRIM